MIGRGVSKTGLIILGLIAVFATWGHAEQRYTVKPGDTLYEIAKVFGIRVETLRAYNQLEGDLIKPNQVLLIPATNEGEASRSVDNKKSAQGAIYYTVRKGDTLSALAARTGVSVNELKRLNALRSTQLQIGQRLLLRGPELGSEEGEEMGDEDQDNGTSTNNGGEEPMTSSPLGKWKGPEERNLFIRVAKTFLGVPYRLGGATMKGIDCSAFVKKVYEIFDIILPRTAHEQSRSGRRIEKHELEEGDLVFFRTPRARRTHVGIYLGNGEFIHASSWSKEVRIDHLDHPYFHQRFYQGVRVKEMEVQS